MIKKIQGKTNTKKKYNLFLKIQNFYTKFITYILYMYVNIYRKKLSCHKLKTTQLQKQFVFIFTKITVASAVKYNRLYSK